MADIADAERAITHLDEHVSSQADTEILARLLLRAESVASSRIEGLEISPQRMLRAIVAQAEDLPLRDELANDVIANISAMAYAISDAAPITVDRILEVHRRLMAAPRYASFAGVIRGEQSWTGGNTYNPIGAAFVPPPPKFVPKLLEDLCSFCNDDHLPPVAQAAIAHAQFETIHPFADGNGRTGRAIVHMVLRRRGLTLRATPPISLILATRAKDYIARLDATRAIGPPQSPQATEALNSWIAFFSAAATRAVADAEAFEQRIAMIGNDWKRRLGNVRSDATVLKLIEILPAAPVLTVKGAAASLNRGFAATNDAASVLVDLGILQPITVGRRNRAFAATEMIDAFTALERQLASPGGDTKASKPERRVPARRPNRGAAE